MTTDDVRAGSPPGRARPAAPAFRAVLFDFGGVLTTSPFEAFARYEKASALPPGFLRALNATNHHANAWAGLERGELSLGEFTQRYEAEARDAGHEVSAGEVLGLLGGDLRPAMVEAVRRCRPRYLTAVATNNFVATERVADAETGSKMAAVLELFDDVVESSKIGIRKPETGFYVACCERLGIEPPQAVFIDDLGVNLKPARELGMHTIKFVEESQAISDLETALQLPLR